MLGTEPMIVDEFVATGQVQLIFIDALDGVASATRLHTMAHCMGLQDPALFWKAHDFIFSTQTQFYSADDQTVIETGVTLGADQAQLETCYYGGDGTKGVETTAAFRDEQGVRGRPVFDIGETRLFGNQDFQLFAEAIQTALEQ